MGAEAGRFGQQLYVENIVGGSGNVATGEAPRRR
jgi:hypothetical protein